MRLGLSATPERHFDPVGTASVLEYFGAIVFEYSLSQAIADGRLCRYHPVLVELTGEEVDEYKGITIALTRILSLSTMAVVASLRCALTQKFQSLLVRRGGNARFPLWLTSCYRLFSS